MAQIKMQYSVGSVNKKILIINNGNLINTEYEFSMVRYLDGAWATIPYTTFTYNSKQYLGVENYSQASSGGSANPSIRNNVMLFIKKKNGYIDLGNEIHIRYVIGKQGGRGYLTNIYKAEITTLPNMTNIELVYSDIQQTDNEINISTHEEDKVIDFINPSQNGLRITLCCYPSSNISTLLSTYILGISNMYIVKK